MKIRKATMKDVQGIIELWREFVTEHDKVVLKENPELKPYIERREDAARTFRRIVRKNINSEDGTVLLAEGRGKTIAFSILQINKNKSIFRMGKIGYIFDIFIRKDFRGRGIGSLFRDEAMKFFRKKGVKHVSLHVSPANSHAHSIYRKWGFMDYVTEMRRKI